MIDELIKESEELPTQKYLSGKMEAEQKLDKYILSKRAKLLAMNNNEMIDPVMQVFDVLQL